MKMKVECPECGRVNTVYEKQTDFICIDESGCAFMCNVDELTGTLECIDGAWKLYDTNTK